MAFALPLIVELFQPLQAMVDWLGGGPAPRRAPASKRGAAMPRSFSGSDGAPAFRTMRNDRSQRVVHVVNAAESRRARGMVISGRIDEVCAELDRLAALDSAH